MTSRPPRASAGFWIDAAVAALSEQGPDGLTIEALCLRTGKTKGSFYAHFDRHDAFIAALVRHWRVANTDEVIQAVEEEASPEDQLNRLSQLSVRLDTVLDRGMRLLAGRNPVVAAAVEEIDEARIGYLAALYQATGSYSQDAARDLATIEYAAYLGLQDLRPRQSADELDRLYAAFRALLARSG